jgi:hypothetical protein
VGRKLIFDAVAALPAAEAVKRQTLFKNMVHTLNQLRHRPHLPGASRGPAARLWRALRRTIRRSRSSGAGNRSSTRGTSPGATASPSPARRGGAIHLRRRRRGQMTRMQSSASSSTRATTAGSSPISSTRCRHGADDRPTVYLRDAHGDDSHHRLG